MTLFKDKAPMGLSVITLGCKVNQYESEAIAQLFQKNGYKLVDDINEADVCVINTCSVTNMSDRKSRQMIRKCVNGNKNPIVAVTGCYSEAKPDEVMSIPGVTVVTGANNKNKLFELINKALKERKRENPIIAPKGEIGIGALNIETAFSERTRGVIKVQDGCNSFCTYCIIPYVRGRCRSRPVDEITAEAGRLADAGCKEIVLAGIHVCNYGIDLGTTFINMLSTLENSVCAKNIPRVRLSSIEPSAFTEDFFIFYKNSQKICPHFHISLQSGSDKIIKAMNRHYTGADFLEITRRLKEINPLTEITTDIIVGFPGETDEDFNDTIRIIKQARLLKVHVFKYSKRDGTAAAKMPGQISGTVAVQRSEAAIKAARDAEKEVLRKYAGQTLNVLFETSQHGEMQGYSENYIPVKVDFQENMLGGTAQVKITETRGSSVFGVLCPIPLT